MNYNQRLREAQHRFTRHIAYLINYANSEGFNLSFGEAWRNRETQEFYVKTGKSKTINSKHLDRLAVDFNFFERGVDEPLFINKLNNEFKKDLLKIKHIGKYWMSLHKNNRWGGDFNRNYNVLDDSFSDPYHFETSVD